MHRSNFILGFIFILSNLSCVPGEPHDPKPNVVFIFADDQSFNAINALGGSELITPNLDKLVSNGVSFSNSFNMGGWSGAVCVASRTMLLTGKFIWEAKQAHELMRANRYNTPVWSELLDSAGYDTYMSGKWHIKKPAKEVFDEVVHVRPGMPRQTDEGYHRPLHKNDTLWKPWDTSKKGYWEGGRHWSEVLGDDAISFIDSASKRENPFFMYLAFNAPHDPRQSPKEYVERYDPDSISLPAGFMPKYPYGEEIGSGVNLRDERLAPFPRTEYAVKVNRQEYYAIITHMDEQIGRILKALEKSGKMENTYVVFAADNGLAVGHHGLMGKQNMYDHSIRIPLIITGPGLPKNEKVNAEVYLQVVMPTVLEIAELKKPEFVDFHSFISLAKGERTKSHYPAIYGCYTNKQRMIRSDGFKLIAYPEADVLRLYDLRNDPDEIKDIAHYPKYTSIKRTLFTELVKLQKEMKDTLDLERYFNF